MSSYIKVFLNYFYIILFAFLFEWGFIGFGKFLLYDVIENILFAVLIISFLYIIVNKKLNRLFYISSTLIFVLSIYFETAYNYLFKTFFSPSAIFIVLDSNALEIKEFINFYTDRPIVFFSLLFFSVSILIFRNNNERNAYYYIGKYKDRLAMTILLLSVCVFLKWSTLIVYNLPYLVLKSIKDYYLETKQMMYYKDNINGDYKNVSRKFNEDERELYVVIIGESTSRSHLGLYNYYRETTPLLQEYKQDLLVYNDVISPHAYSVAALTKILTFGNYENPKNTAKGSIIQLINSAGLETFWISNQRPIGPYESMITKISLSAKNYKFLTTTIAGNSKILDEEIIKEFDKILKNKSKKKKKVVFLHLMGTHHHYENRYPPAYNKFNNSPKTKFKSDESFSKINHYDNAILYNDYIISEVIRKIDSLNCKSFALYFSDHGEEMFDDLDMAGHNEDVYSQKMFDIPFFLWQSNSYKKDKKLYYFQDRKYMIDDLFHSIADLLNISAKEVDSTRSIFSRYFTERKRIIKDTIDYDVFFK